MDLSEEQLKNAFKEVEKEGVQPPFESTTVSKSKNQVLVDFLELELIELKGEFASLDKKLGLIQWNSYVKDKEVTEQHVDAIFNDLMRLQEKTQALIKKIVESEAGRKFKG